MANRHKMHRASGGRTSFVDSKVVNEAKETKDKFKFGGKVAGEKSKPRADKRARGGGVGGSPFSSAAQSMDKGNKPVERKPRARGGACKADGGATEGD
jgi:hypothetical protein